MKKQSVETTSLRHLQGLAFAALLALSLWLTAADAVARSGRHPLWDFLDPGSAPGNSDDHRRGPRPLGRFGVSWE